MNEHDATTQADDAMRNSGFVDHEGSGGIRASLVALLTFEHVDELVTVMSMRGHLGAWCVAQQGNATGFVAFVQHVNFHACS